MLPAPKAKIGTDRNTTTTAHDRKRLKDGLRDDIVILEKVEKPFEIRTVPAVRLFCGCRSKNGFEERGGNIRMVGVFALRHAYGTPYRLDL